METKILHNLLAPESAHAIHSEALGRLPKVEA